MRVGEILSQKSFNVEIKDEKSGKEFLEAIGYKEIMEIKDNNIVYGKNNFQIATKNIENGENLIEIEIDENDERYNNIDKIKEKLISLNLPLYMDNFFVKKAEIELEKKLKNKTFI